MSESQYEVIVFGATSFVGQILADYLLERHGTGGDLKWAIAGRSQSKLDELKNNLGSKSKGLPVVVADAGNETDLRNMCDQADVIISTVGPYALYGSTLVKVCAETGTDYCDLTGELQWISKMIRQHEATAKKSGARIVHCSGFDSIPSDLGVHFLQQAAKEKFGEPCTKIKMRVKAIKGGMSGGTVASLMNVSKEIAKSPELRKEIANPYSLCPDSYNNPTRQPNVTFAEYDEDAKSWVAPFIMAGINTRVVQRSNALLGKDGAKSLSYDEAMMTGDGIKGRMTAMGAAAGMGGFMMAAIIPPSRWVLNKFVVPQPGEGPSPEAQKAGFYDLRFYGATADGRKIKAKVTGDRDPGYGSTAKMLGEAGVSLAKDVEIQQAGGFWTPATMFGDTLIDRMVEHSGLTFELL